MTINYRLGPLGFLALPGTNIQGNMGMKDQLMAMRWVKQNIAKFGGDPGRITISGLSAGAVSVHAHILSPLGQGEGLFHRAMAQSGTMLMGVGIDRPYRDSRRLLENLCNMNTTTEGIPQDLSSSCLFTLSAEDIVKETTKPFTLWTKPTLERIQIEKSDPSFVGYAMWPCIDDYATTPFLPTHPITIIHNQQQKMVPFMTGVTKEEGAMISPGLWKDMDPSNNIVKDNWGWLGAKTLKYDYEITFEDELEARMIAHFYVGEGGLVKENKQGLTDMLTDAYFAAPNNEAVKLHAKAPAPVYNYLFSYKGSFTMATFYSMGNAETLKEDWGVAHGDDAQYMLKLKLKGQPTVVTEDDKKMVEIMQKLISNFVRYGDPTPVEYDDIPKWNPAQKSRAACIYMDLSLTPTEAHRMFTDRMTFWHMLRFKAELDEYAVDLQEAEMLVEIENAIEEDEHDDDDDDSDDDSEEDDSDESDEGLTDENMTKRRRMRRIRWIRRNIMRKIQRPGRKARMEARKKRKLAKKMQSMM